MDFSLWWFLAWIVIVLYGMDLLEEAIKEFSGETLKKWLKKFANTPLKSLFSWSVLGAILQSSAVTILIIMAFASAWYISLPSAIWATMGANVGSTALWILVVYIWFSFSIASFSLGMIAIWGILYKFISYLTWKRVWKIILSFGFLFFGISLLKDSVWALAAWVDFSIFSHIPLIWWFGIWLVLTMIMQSSWAMSIITLWALHWWVVTFPQSIAIIAGANIGTCITPLFAAIKWAAEKKQVAVSHIVYNVFASTLVMIFILPISDIMQNIYNFSQPWAQETALAMYQLIYNVIASFIFMPFIKPLAKFLEKIFPDKTTTYVLGIDKIWMTEVDIALPVIKDDAIMLLKKIFKFNLHHLRIDQKKVLDDDVMLEDKIKWEYKSSKDHLMADYNTCKNIEEDLLTYILKLMTWSSISQKSAKKLQSLYYSVERMMYAGKAWKDVYNSSTVLFDADSDFIDLRLEQLRKNMAALYAIISDIIDKTDIEKNYNMVEDVTELIKEDNKKFLADVGEYIEKNQLEEWLLADLFHLSQAYERSNDAIVDALEVLFIKS